MLLNPDDRILVFAPHPDDETLAIGGLLATAFDRGLPVRVVYLTSGDRNPWAQRFVERRWTLRDEDRARWGKLREAEAIAALEVLGGNSADACFLRYPDQALTKLLLSGERAVIDDLRAELLGWKPTLMLQPAAEDAHPDHSALHVLLSAIVAPEASTNARVLNYLVHQPRAGQARKPMTTSLNRALIKRKLKAIFCHRTQVAAGRKRFASYARPQEQLFDGEPLETSFPPQSVPWIDGNFLNLPIAQCVLCSKKQKVLLVLRTESGDVQRFAFCLKGKARHLDFQDTVTGETISSLEVYWNRRTVQVRLPKMPRLSTAILKVCTPTLFFDRAGWLNLPVFQRPSKRLKAHGSELVGKAIADSPSQQPIAND